MCVEKYVQKVWDLFRS